jgi:hypothetical protein
MAWEDIEERLKKVFKVQISFPHGSVWLPDTHVTIDECLTSLAETDEELKQLSIQRIRFLQNRWPLEKLVELRWDVPVSKRAIWAMNIKNRAYILFFDGVEYQLIAAIEPRTNSTLYRAVISKLLQNPTFVPTRPTTIKNYRPDLMFDIEAGPETAEVSDIDWIGPASHQPKHKEGYLSRLLVGWVGKWVDLPVLGYWHEDAPDSITTPEKGSYVMKYKARSKRAA